MRNIISLLLLVALVGAIGCSAGSIDPVSVDPSASKTPSATHQLLGLWQFAADPAEGRLDIVPLRSSAFHLNALPFLEPPPLLNLTLESLQFNGNIIEADIGLRHPFLGLTEFTGFDVSGLLITNGSVAGFNDPALRLTGDGDTRLLNPDGYSRWWNPAEFPIGNTMFNYKDGLLGTPDSSADYSSTLNACKYFCDDLTTPDAPMSDVTLPKRGMFGAGQKNVRHYTIELGSEGLVFNYAVDASWQYPNGLAPWVAPDDFGPGANRSEAWNAVITETSNTLWNDGTSNGGDLKLSIDVYDWFNAGLNTVRVESPGNFAMTESAPPTGGGDGYSTYEIDILAATPAEGQIDLLLSVMSEQENFENFLPGVNTTSYFTHKSDVGTEQPGDIFKNIPLLAGTKPFDIAIDPSDGRVLIIYDNEEVWQYLPSDNYQFPNPNNKLYDTDWQLVKPPGAPGTNVVSAFIEIAGNHYAIIDFSWYVNDWVNRAWYDVINLPGQLVKRLVPVGIYFGVSYPNYEAMGFGDTGANPAYHNRLAVVWGHALPYYSFVNWSAPTDNYNTTPYVASYLGSSSTNLYGKGKVYGPWVRGAEVDKDDMHTWYVEASDFYCARFLDVTYDNAFCGTGAKTDDDTGFNDPKDLTRDVNNNLVVLDILADGSSRLKAFDPIDSTDTVPALSLGGFTLDDIIIGTALRVDCGAYIFPSHGNPLVVIHGNATDGYYMSFFFPDELPW